MGRLYKLRKGLCRIMKESNCYELAYHMKASEIKIVCEHSKSYICALDSEYGRGGVMFEYKNLHERLCWYLVVKNVGIDFHGFDFIVTDGSVNNRHENQYYLYVKLEDVISLEIRFSESSKYYHQKSVLTQRDLIELKDNNQSNNFWLIYEQMQDI